jgi:hypothetical protein
LTTTIIVIYSNTANNANSVRSNRKLIACTAVRSVVGIDDAVAPVSCKATPMNLRPKSAEWKLVLNDYTKASIRAAIAFRMSLNSRLERFRVD